MAKLPIQPDRLTQATSWSTPAGLLSAAFAMDAELERSGAAYRALSMPFYLENLLGQPDAIHEQGAFYLTYAGDRPLASIATRDIADAAAALLTDRSWAGQMNLPVFGPDRLTEMLAAQDAGLYDADWAAATPAVTNFRTWCEEVLSPAASA